MGPVCAVEADTGRAVVLVDERLVYGELPVRREVEHAHLVVSVDTGAGYEVVRDGDSPRRIGLRVRAIGTAAEVIQRAPVRPARRAIGDGQHARDRRAI